MFCFAASALCLVSYFLSNMFQVGRKNNQDAQRHLETLVKSLDHINVWRRSGIFCRKPHLGRVNRYPSCACFLSNNPKNTTILVHHAYFAESLSVFGWLKQVQAISRLQVCLKRWCSNYSRRETPCFTRSNAAWFSDLGPPTGHPGNVRRCGNCRASGGSIPWLWAAADQRSTLGHWCAARLRWYSVVSWLI